MPLRVLCAGAAKGLVSDLRDKFGSETGMDIDGIFSAVGAIKEKFVAGEACDVLVLTQAAIDELTSQGLLLAGSNAPIGSVHTGVAVPAGHPQPDISTGEGLAAAIKAANAVYIPDPYRSTAGIHFMTVLKQLGIEGDVMAHLRPFPNGATAMGNLSRDAGQGSIGCTQITEIKYTSGLSLVGSLPRQYDLATVYTAAVSAGAANPAQARRLVALLTGAQSRDLRVAGGFEPVCERPNA
jgi:molybdate transport system substrate-binding protein